MGETLTASGCEATRSASTGWSSARTRPALPSRSSLAVEPMFHSGLDAQTTSTLPLFNSSTYGVTLELGFRGNRMIRVCVIANDSLLGDAMAWVLSREGDLEVLRLTPRELGDVYQAIHEHRAEVIILDESLSDDQRITAKDLLRKDGRLLVITMSPQKPHLEICESYQISNPGLAQVVDLVRASSRTCHCEG